MMNSPDAIVAVLGNPLIAGRHSEGRPRTPLVMTGLLLDFIDE